MLSQDYRSNAPGGDYATYIRFDRLSDEETKYAGEMFLKLDAWAQLERLRQSGVNVLEQPGKGAALAEQLIKALDGSTLESMPHVASVDCTCSDLHTPDKWCKHIAALGYQLIQCCAADPFYPFYLRQLNLKGLHRMLPRKRARNRLPGSRNAVIDLTSFDDDRLMIGSSSRHAIECD